MYYDIFINMKNSIKKILKESYEKQVLKDICNTLTTGDNYSSIPFIENKVQELLSLNLPADKLESIKNIYFNWKRDMNEMNKDKPKHGGLKGATAESQGDISNFYLSQLQDEVCPIFMEMD